MEAFRSLTCLLLFTIQVVQGEVFFDDSGQVDLSNAKDFFRSFVSRIEYMEQFCFNIELEPKHEVRFTFEVLNSNPQNAQKLTMSLLVVESKERLVTHQELSELVFKHKPTIPSNYLFCLSTSVGPDIPREVLWEISVKGMMDDSILESKFEQAAVDFIVNEATQETRDRLETIYMRLRASQKFQILHKAHNTMDYHYVKALNAMVDQWSLIHAILVIVCYVAQVYFLKRLFVSPQTSRHKMRA